MEALCLPNFMENSNIWEFFEEERMVLQCNVVIDLYEKKG
jgi:hypothetical protein